MKQNHLNANYHTHTVFCDGSDTAEDVVREALKKGFRHLGFSGHMDPGVHMNYGDYYAEIRRLQKAYPQIDILLGLELDCIYDSDSCMEVRSGGGSWDVIEECEYTIGSTHFIPAPGSDIWADPVPFGSIWEGNSALIGVDGSPEDLRNGCVQNFGGDYYELAAAYYRFEASVVRRLSPTFIGHFDLVSRFNDLPEEEGGHFLDETDHRYLDAAEKAVRRILEDGREEVSGGATIPFEINCGAVNRGRKRYLYPRPEILRMIHDYGGEVLISSDAHQKELLDGAFPEALNEARDAGFDHVLILAHLSEEEADELMRQGISCRIAANTESFYSDRPVWWVGVSII